MKDAIRKNREYWDRASRSYQDSHGESLAESAMSWGVWRLPEKELRVLGDARGRDMLELGCGGAQWAEALAGEGAHVVGVDFSRGQLDHARARCHRGHVVVPLLLGDAEALLLADESFDVVFCDHGAMSFARPEPCVAEASRVLRSGGLFAFCMASPIHSLCWDDLSDTVGTVLARHYFGLDPLEDSESTCFQRTYGDWLRIFRGNGFVVEDLVEPRPPAGAQTT